MQLNCRFFALLYLVSTATASADDSLALSECREIADSMTRLACYDALADRAETPLSADLGSSDESDIPPIPDAPIDAPAPAEASPSPVAATPADEAPTVGQALTLPDAEVLFGRSETEITDIAIERSGQQALERLESTVTRIVSVGNGRLRYELENGQHWQQIERERFQVRVGQAVEVRRASLGSFFMKKVGTNRSTRVKRVD